MTRRKSKYARRPRDFEFMGFVKTIPCYVTQEWPNVDSPPTPCTGVVEADHMGRRGLGQKCDDKECGPICTGHHRERTDHTGSFKHVTREREREWRGAAVLFAQTLYAERNGEQIA